MPISSDIKRVIEILHQRKQALDKIEEMLLREFGGGEESISLGAASPQAMFDTKEPQKIESPKTKKQFLIEFIKSHGAQTRKELEEKTGVPKGTIASCLNDKEAFVRRADRKWTVK